MRPSHERADPLKALTRLFDAALGAADELPPALAQLYGGPLALGTPCLYANFVSSIDGVVAIDGGKAPSGGIISGRNEADRFVMGLLRAFADAILVGAGTVRAEGGKALWTPQYIFPAAAGGYRAMREKLGRAKDPLLAIVTARGDLEPSEPAIQQGALVLTTKESEPALRRRLPSSTRVIGLSSGPHLEPGAVVAALTSEGHRAILTEGGPSLFGELVAAGLVDELFLTVSPTLAGQADNKSFGLVHGVDFSKHLKWVSLQSARQHESYLFLRYRLKEAA
ncbi:MAG: dihydrofolate reductase family protein [Candidatus Dormibacteraeota bacterium]|nr:dihydrofolate reductase family protein [Candidatus Dormibacteraeota bacterium]